MKRCLATILLIDLCLTLSASQAGQPPYPPSPVIKKITWHRDTLVSAAPG